MSDKNNCSGSNEIRNSLEYCAIGGCARMMQNVGEDQRDLRRFWKEIKVYNGLQLNATN